MKIELSDSIDMPAGGARQQSPKILILKIGGEGGIRTLGPVLPGQHISSVPLSATQAPLHG